MARALAVLCVLLLAAAAEAQRARGFWYTRAAAKTVVGVVAFSEDGTRALLQEKQSARGHTRAGIGGGVAIATSYVIVDGTGTLFEVRVSDAIVLPGQGPLEGIDNATCRARVADLEQALAGFRAVRARASGCARPGRADDVIDLIQSTPSPLPISDELLALQQELGTGTGVVFVNERGPLVVMLRPSFEDPFGKSNEALTFLRSDPRIHDRWPSP